MLEPCGDVIDAARIQLHKTDDPITITLLND
jgi:hypothetical protein